MPAVLNASDEVAVSAFLNDKIGFVDVFNIVEQVVMQYKNIKNPTLDDILYADAHARALTNEIISKK